MLFSELNNKVGIYSTPAPESAHFAVVYCKFLIDFVQVHSLVVRHLSIANKLMTTSTILAAVKI